MVVAIRDPVPSNHSIDLLCEQFYAIELRRELRTTKEGGTSEDPVALLAKQRGSKGSGGSISTRGERKGESSSSSYKTKKLRVTCYGCGKRGHMKYECRSSKRQEKGGQTRIRPLGVDRTRTPITVVVGMHPPTELPQQNLLVAHCCA